MPSSIISITTRFFDLDSQMHVNNASYLNYVREGLYYNLSQKGFDFDYIFKNKIELFPEKVMVSFHHQQRSQINLRVMSNFFKLSDSKLVCVQDVYNSDEHACKFVSKLKISESSILNQYPDIDKLPYDYSIPEFKESAKRSLMKYKIRHIDLNAFSNCYESVIWRLNEEARWNFFAEAGLSFEELKENDMALFWIEGAYDYFNPVKLNDELTVYTWVNRLDRVRVYISQEIYSQNKRILISEGQFLTVSLSRSKPVRIPEIIINAFKPFTENFADNKLCL